MASCNTDQENASEAPSQGSSLMSRMALNDNKAGMEGLDKEKINQIIYNASKGSKFYENERKKEEQLNERIREQQLLASRINVKKLREGQHQADLLMEELLQHRDLNHTIVHVDMDAFYAAVEMRDNPTLKNKPMAVGGMGMLSTSNYLARKYGVRAAMPGFIGLKLCPELVMVPPNFEKYTAVSQDIRQVLAVYDPNFSPMSLDEAYLDFGPHLQYRAGSPPSARTFILHSSEESDVQTGDVSSDLKCTCDLNCVLLPSFLELDELSSTAEQGLQHFVCDFDSKTAPENIPKICDECKRTFPNYCLKVYGLTIEDAVLEMRNRIEQRTALTASAGIAPNTMLAKICSDKNKPNGQYRILPDILAVEEFVMDLPIRKISGVGKVTEKLLGALGVVKCSDIYEHRALLYHLFSPTSFHHFMRIYLGMGSTVVQRDEERKSISTERTFSEISNKVELCHKCDEMSLALAEDLKEAHLKGKTVTLKIKCVSFEVKTRSHTLQNATNDAAIIKATAKQLLLTEIKNVQPALLRLRLMGVRMSKLLPEEKKEVTVKDMFRKFTAGPSSSHNQDESTRTDTPPHLMLDTSDDLLIAGENHVVVTSADNSPSKEDIMMASRASHSKKSNQKGLASSENIMKFLTKEPVTKDFSCTKSQVLDRNVQPTPNEAVTIRSMGISLDSSNELKKVSGKSSSSNDRCEDISSVCEEEVIASSDYFDQDTNSLDACRTSLDVNFGTDCFPESLTCPVCGVTGVDWDLNSLNSHVDVCLSQRTIREMLHHEKNVSDVATASSSSSSSVSLQQANKRAGSEKHRNQLSENKPKKIQRTVASFFQR